MRTDESSRRLIFAALNKIRAGKHRRINQLVRVAEHFTINPRLVEKFIGIGRTFDNHARRDFDFRLIAHVQIKFFVAVKTARRDKNFFQDVEISVAVKFGAAGEPSENSCAVSADKHVRNFFCAIMSVVVQNFYQLAEIMEKSRRRELSRLQNIFDLRVAGLEFQIGKIFFAVLAKVSVDNRLPLSVVAQFVTGKFFARKQLVIVINRLEHLPRRITNRRVINNSRRFAADNADVCRARADVDANCSLREIACLAVKFVKVISRRFTFGQETDFRTVNSIATEFLE